MGEGVNGKFGRGRFVVMAIAVLTGMASLWLLFLAYFWLREPGVTVSQIAILALISLFMFAASLLCLIALLLRYLSIAALRVSTHHEPTEYVNAWQASAARLALDDELPHEPGDDDVIIEIGDDEEEPDENDENDR